MKKKNIPYIIISICLLLSACTNQTESESEIQADTNQTKSSEPTAKAREYNEPLTQVGKETKHPLGTFVLKQISEPNVTLETDSLRIQIERIKIVHSTKLSDIAKYNLKTRGLNTKEMNAIQLTTTLENTSNQQLNLEKGPIKRLVLSNGEEVDVESMNADPKIMSLKANEKEEFTLICFLSQEPNQLNYVKIIPEVQTQSIQDNTNKTETFKVKM
ncbi:hypothetical protein [Mechercharimyces sp. CAU 1602]|uniref:hypothetical protein n=1 Tax=Mechercharimyces sp. CAU 1602 TaxID=2973933 RepID=UPI0021628484|nr:hypothetical protein [Mechercharimyces sp. CAU 1602]MCS1351936.1 hypothetical protein [Mechercharimyces sp. CAU 1602]